MGHGHGLGRGLRDRRSFWSLLDGQKVSGSCQRRLRWSEVLPLPLDCVMESRLRRGERGGQRRLVGREGRLEVGRRGERRCVGEGGGGGWRFRWGELVLFEGSRLRRRTPVHVAAVLRPLRPAVVRILELALVSARLVTPGALGPAGRVHRGGLPAGEIGLLREGRTRLARGMRGSLGLGRVLP